MAAIVSAHPFSRQCATIFITSGSISAVGWRKIALDALNDQRSKREVVVYSSQPAGYLCSIGVDDPLPLSA
jgi:hypothetical protein